MFDLISERNSLHADIARLEAERDACLAHAHANYKAWADVVGENCALRAERDAAVQRAADTERRVVGEIAEWLEGPNYERRGSPSVAQYTCDLVRSIRAGAYRKQQESKTTQGARDV